MTTAFTDEPRDLRDEDAFDVGGLHRWLSAWVDDRCRRVAGIA